MFYLSLLLRVVPYVGYRVGYVLIHVSILNLLVLLYTIASRILSRYPDILIRILSLDSCYPFESVIVEPTQANPNGSLSPGMDHTCDENDPIHDPGPNAQ